MGYLCWVSLRYNLQIRAWGGCDVCASCGALRNVSEYASPASRVSNWMTGCVCTCMYTYLFVYLFIFYKHTHIYIHILHICAKVHMYVQICANVEAFRGSACRVQGCSGHTVEAFHGAAPIIIWVIPGRDDKFVHMQSQLSFAEGNDRHELR